MNPMLNAERSVLMIGAGMLRPKKAGNPLSPLHRYLNYGLLGLAGALRGKGFSPRVFHGHFSGPAEFVDGLEGLGWLDTLHPVLLSIPSSYALDWSREVCRLIKERRPGAKIVVGGRWVVAEDGAWLRSQIPEVDLVVYGTAEQVIERVLEPRRWKTIQQSDVSLFPILPGTSTTLSRMDYTLLDGADEFTPSFEISRGCGRNCGFCAESKVPLSAPKSASELADEIERATVALGRRDFNAYFEASLFQPSTDWCNQLVAEMKARDLALRWRAETRVDHLAPRQVDILARAGLKVLDLGLESASPQQLGIMEKTASPTTYLRKASELLQACYDQGIWAKVNVLLYAGETEETLDETRIWLDQHAGLIKGVSAGPLVVYRYGDESKSFLADLAKHGTRPVSETALDDLGYADLHLSDVVSHGKAIELARTISRSMMRSRDYFDLKGFSYLPPGMTYETFLAHCEGADPDALPFSSDAMPV
jgi:Radical SAM superfamily/B12 binding domain